MTEVVTCWELGGFSMQKCTRHKPSGNPMTKLVTEKGSCGCKVSAYSYGNDISAETQTASDVFQ